jgi:periplasmic protein TonB
MKRNEKKVPGFDEIIFRNRNREYGAYDLRKRYKAAASLSLLCVSAFFTALILIVSEYMTPEAIADGGSVIFVPVDPEAYVAPPVQIDPVLPKTPVEKPAYVPPIVTDDTVSKANPFMSADQAIANIDETFIPERIDSVMKEIAPNSIPDDEPVVFSQEPPIFPGGPDALLKYIADNTQYPQEAIDINLQGKVIVKFAVLKDGSVSRIQILRGVNSLLDDEAQRVVSTLPKWKPGKQNGNPVSVWFSVPVNFRIANMN